MRENRSVLLYLLLSILTLSLYHYWFLHKWAEDVNEMCDGDGDETRDVGMMMLLSIMTVGVYKYVWFSLLADRIYDNAPRYGADIREDGEGIFTWIIIGLLFFGLGPLIGLTLMIHNTNRLARAYNASLVRKPANKKHAFVSVTVAHDGALLGLQGDYAGCQIMIPSGGSVVIGRDSTQATVVVHGPKISRRHCKIYYDGTRRSYFLTDYSINGVIIDGRRAPPRTELTLTPGVQFQLADGKNRFRLL